MAAEWIEYLAVAFNIAYVLLAAKGSIWCWPMGIIGSALGIALFIEVKLYAEAILFTYYVIVGVYGWAQWKKNQTKGGDLRITEWPLPTHLAVLFGGYLVSVGLYFLLSTFTDAQMPMLDSFTTVFSFITTWMVARRLLENWIYWIAINGLTVYLYLSRDLNLYALLSLVYTGMSVYGYIRWLRETRKQTFAQ